MLLLLLMMMILSQCAGCRAEKIVNTDDEVQTESTQELLHQLIDCRAKCCNNLAAAQMKVLDSTQFLLVL